MYVEICIMNHKGPFHTNTTPQTLFNSSTVTVLRRPANRPDAQLLESATVV